MTTTATQQRFNTWLIDQVAASIAEQVTVYSTFDQAVSDARRLNDRRELSFEAPPVGYFASPGSVSSQEWDTTTIRSGLWLDEEDMSAAVEKAKTLL